MREKKTPNKRGKSTRSSKKDQLVRTERREPVYEDNRFYYDEMPESGGEGYYDEQGYYRDGYDAYDAVSFPTDSEVIVSSAPAASIGVIGGADGPTKVFVTAG